MITEIEDYFVKGCGRCHRFDTPDCSAQIWSEGQAALRRILLDMGLSEHVKWGHPCYMHAGRNICVMGAFRDNMRLSFTDAALLKDPNGILERQGPNTQVPDMLRFTSTAQVTEREDIIRAYLAEAMASAEQGVRPEKAPQDIELPNELIEAMDSDPELAEAFQRLTPGRQKSYVIAIQSAKGDDTRRARIAKYRDKILAGKGALDR